MLSEIRDYKNLLSFDTRNVTRLKFKINDNFFRHHDEDDDDNKNNSSINNNNYNNK